ncbi:MAG: SRPBCC family protein [Anaerolineales bacterium]
MKNGFTISDIIPAQASEIYEAWLNSEGHAAMTGSAAQVDGKVGGKFKAWDGYIFGTTLDLTPNQRIVQAWRTSEFPDDTLDSRVEILLEEVEAGTKLTFIHSDMPEGQVESYRRGWNDFYYKPMKAYFGKR